MRWKELFWWADEASVLLKRRLMSPKGCRQHDGIETRGGTARLSG